MMGTSFNQIRRMSVYALLLAALFIFTSTSSVNARSEIVAEAGKWSIATIFDDDDGTFLRCVATTSERNNPNRFMGVAINRQSELEIWFGDDDWQLKEDTSYEFDYQIDRFERRRSTFVTTSQTMGYFEAGQAEDTFAEMRRGYTLHILTNRTQMQFSLTGSSRALKLMRKCWNHHLDQMESATNPFGSPDGEQAKNPFETRAATSSRKSGSERKRKAKSNDEKTSIILAKFVTRRLSDEGFKAYEKVPAAFAEMKLDMVWEAPGVWGMTKQISVDASMEILAEGVALKNKRECVGKFASDTYDRDFYGRGTVTVLKLACTDDGQGDPYFGIYSFYPTRSGDKVMVAHVGMEPRPAVNADTSFFDTLGELLKK